MHRLFLFIFCCFSSSLFAISVRLQNDTAYPLRSVLYGRDGAFLADILVNSQATVKWADTNSPIDNNEEHPPQGPKLSQTPLLVIWYCMDGGQYGVSDNVSTGSLVVASHSVGNRHCGPPKKKEDINQTGEKP